MSNLKQLESLFRKYKFDDFKWIDPKDIVVVNWVRMKCKFGFPEFLNNVSCPPNTPSVAESRELMSEYHSVVVFDFSESFKKPEDRFP